MRMKEENWKSNITWKCPRLAELLCNYCYDLYSISNLYHNGHSMFNDYSYLHPDILFSYTMILAAFFIHLSHAFLIVLYYGVVSFIFSVYIIKIRFRQVFDRINFYALTKINSTIDDQYWRWQIQEHNEICLINQRKQLLMRFILFQLLFWYTYAWFEHFECILFKQYLLFAFHWISCMLFCDCILYLGLCI